jgi:Tol biopolymer transport system component
MRLPIDPSTGEALGPPRQVTLEPAMGGFAVSPDGDQIAYATGDIGYSMSLRVLPARGGNAETVVDVSGLIIGSRWGPNGDSLYYVHWANVQVPEAAVMRVPVGGGEPERVSVWDDWISLGPRAQHIFRRISSAETEQNLYEVTSVDGRPLARFGLPEPFTLGGFGRRPDEVYAVRHDVVSPLRVVTLAGGPVRRLNEAWSYDVPLDWSPDGREVLFATSLNGEEVIMFAPSDGGPMRQVPIPDNRLPGTRTGLFRGGRQILYLSAGEADGEHGIWVYDITRDTAIQVDEGRIPAGTAGGRWEIKGTGPGNGFLYGLTRDGHHELMEAQPDGSVRVLWSFEDTGEEPPKVRVRGDLIAFTRNDGEEGSLFVARVGTQRERRLLALPGEIAPRGSRPPTWSPDGDLLAVSYIPPGEGRARELLLAEVREDGELVGDPRPFSLEGGPTWWWDDIAWLPDGRHFLVIGGKGDGPGVWLVSLDPDTPPVEVTSEVEGSVWSYVLSPDGRHIAIESEIPRGSSIWRVQLGEIPGGRIPVSKGPY